MLLKGEKDWERNEKKWRNREKIDDPNKSRGRMNAKGA